MGLLTPSPSINYNFVAGVYGFFAFLSALFFVLQKYTDSVEGFYIVVLPFVPCFAWSLLVRQRWLVTREAGKTESSGDSKEAKKDQ